jgi:hopene-associated glycosyltransferase HpnB
MATDLTLLLGFLALVVWVYLIGARGAFWLGSVTDREPIAWNGPWPPVVAVIPARDEADCIATSLGSLMAQRYPGRFEIVLVDDDSSDGTGDIARRIAETGARPLTVIPGSRLPQGWTGKLWALKRGIEAAHRLPEAPRYLLLTDADIVHTADAVASLVARSERDGLVLASLMAKLRCQSLAERSHVPASIFFFQMLYPFAWVNAPRARTAAAAGGCELLRADALEAAGGIESIKDALIDDCTLASQMKRQGPIWLGLTERVQSIRPYPHWRDVRRMVTRSAYAQLHYSPLLLLGTTAGMALTFLAGPLLAIFAGGLPQLLGFATWMLMTLAFQPTLRFYGLSPLWGVALPAIAALYTAYTVESALQYMSGRGGSWKGRVQANVSAR